MTLIFFFFRFKAQLNEEARKRKLEESIRVSEQLALAAVKFSFLFFFLICFSQNVYQ